jgi:hypothetical protein
MRLRIRATASVPPSGGVSVFSVFGSAQNTRGVDAARIKPDRTAKVPGKIPLSAARASIAGRSIIVILWLIVAYRQLRRSRLRINVRIPRWLATVQNRIFTGCKTGFFDL